MKISIIIPVYNVEKYLDETINSVLNQSYENIEILLINDGSTDNSLSICKKYANKYQSIRLLDQENGGLSEARNRGIHNATGDYLLFLDSDDYWVEDLLETLVERLKKNENIEYLFFRHFEYYQTKGVKKERFYTIKSDEVNQLKGPEVLLYILGKEKYFPWYAWSSIIKSDFIKRANLSFEKGRSYEDVLWTPALLLKAGHIAFLDKALYVYRQEREGQITSNFSYKNLSDSIYIADYWVKNTRSLVNNDELRKKLIKNIIMRYFFAVWFSGFLNKQEKELIFKELKENKYLLKYRDTLIQKLTYFLLKSIGFSGTSLLFKSCITIKRWIVKK